MTVVALCNFNVTAHPTAEWTGQQLREAFPFDQLPCYLLRDRDAIFGDEFRRQVRDTGIHDVLSTPRSPWQRAYVERVIGSIRRECIDHVIVFHESSLRRILEKYFDYYHRSRTHLSLEKDSPLPQPIQPPEPGPVVAVPQVGGLHHRTNDRSPERAGICSLSAALEALKSVFEVRPYPCVRRFLSPDSKQVRETAWASQFAGDTLSARGCTEFTLATTT